jgi:hypothetical protein
MQFSKARGDGIPWQLQIQSHFTCSDRDAKAKGFDYLVPKHSSSASGFKMVDCFLACVRHGVLLEDNLVVLDLAQGLLPVAFVLGDGEAKHQQRVFEINVLPILRVPVFLQCFGFFINPPHATIFIHSDIAIRQLQRFKLLVPLVDFG